MDSKVKKKEIPSWKCHAHTIKGVPEHSGLSLIWTIKHLAEQTEPTPMPPDYHLTLRHELLSDVKAAYANASLCREGLMNTAENSETFWVSYSQAH